MSYLKKFEHIILWKFLTGQTHHYFEHSPKNINIHNLSPITVWTSFSGAPLASGLRIVGWLFSWHTSSSLLQLLSKLETGQQIWTLAVHFRGQLRIEHCRHSSTLAQSPSSLLSTCTSFSQGFSQRRTSRGGIPKAHEVTFICALALHRALLPHYTNFMRSACRLCVNKLCHQTWNLLYTCVNRLHRVLWREQCKPAV